MDARARRKLTHLERLEAESIHIMREVVAEAEQPVMLYSVGKDSAVMLHLARRRSIPSPPPFPLLHVDTTWKFRACTRCATRRARDAGMELLVYQNPEAIERGHQPVRSRPAAHRHVEDRRAEAGARPVRLRRGVRRRAARRGEEPRQGAHLLLPHRQPPLGPEEPAARAVEPLQRAQGARARASASSRSRTGPSSTSGNISTSRTSRSSRSISPRRARPSSATGCC